MQGSTPTPSGNTTIASVLLRHSFSVNTRSSVSTTADIHNVYVGCVCITTRCKGSCFKRVACVIKCAGHSLVNLPPSRQPHSNSAVWQSSAMRIIPRFVSGSLITFLKYLPVPVNKKYLHASDLSHVKLSGIVRSTLLVSRYSASSASSKITDTFPPLRSSQPWRYIFAVTSHISLINFDSKMFFIVQNSVYLL